MVISNGNSCVVRTCIRYKYAKQSCRSNYPD